MVDIATLGIAVDSRDAKTAAGDLDKLAQVGTKTEAAMGKVAAAAKKTAADVNSIGNSAKQTAFAMRQLPMQMTDIVTGLTTGQSPFYVLMQQGGQLKDVFGGIGPAARAVGGYVAGLANPFTIAAAAVGVLALAYKQGSDEQTAFSKSIITTGNYAGVTTGQLADMASAIDDQVGTAHQAAAALSQLVGTGRIYGDQLQELAQSAIAWERATGTAVEDTVKVFAELAKDPVEASAKLNETMHYLTLSIYEQIKALKDQGREQDAAVVAEKAYAAALDDRSKEIEKSLGYIESGWVKVKDGAADAWDAILGVGREATLDEKLHKLYLLREFAVSPDAKGNLDKQISDINTQKLIQEGNARMWAEEKRIQDAGIVSERAVQKIRDETLSNAEKREKEIAEYRRNIENIRAANMDSPLLDPKRQAQDIQNIRDKYKDQKQDPLIVPEYDLSKIIDGNAEMDKEVMTQIKKTNDEYMGALQERLNISELHVKGFWENYLDSAEKALGSFDNLAASTIENFSRGFGNAFEDVIFNATSMSDAFDGLMNGMARAVVNALGQMAAQWVAYQLVQLAVGKTAQANAATGMIANAQAMAFQAQINSFASMAAIPVYGWAAAPGAAAGAAAFTEPLVAAVSAAALSGIAHDGFTNIPREGTWLLNGGERVVAPQQNKDLTEFLSMQMQGGGGDSIAVHLSVSAVDAKSVDRLLVSRGDAIARSLARQIRDYSRPR